MRSPPCSAGSRAPVILAGRVFSPSVPSGGSCADGDLGGQGSGSLLCCRCEDRACWRRGNIFNTHCVGIENGSLVALTRPFALLIRKYARSLLLDGGLSHRDRYACFYGVSASATLSGSGWRSRYSATAVWIRLARLSPRRSACVFHASRVPLRACILI